MAGNIRNGVNIFGVVGNFVGWVDTTSPIIYGTNIASYYHSSHSDDEGIEGPGEMTGITPYLVRWWSYSRYTTAQMNIYGWNWVWTKTANAYHFGDCAFRISSSANACCGARLPNGWNSFNGECISYDKQNYIMRWKVSTIYNSIKSWTMYGTRVYGSYGSTGVTGPQPSKLEWWCTL